MILAIQLALALTTIPYIARNLPQVVSPIDSRLQCYSPNVARRTCQTLVQYRSIGGYSYASSATVLISAKPLITMRLNTPVRVVKDAICGMLQSADITNATLLREGRAAPRDFAQPILAQVVIEMAPVIRRETCTRFSATPTGFVAKVSINGVYQPALDRSGIWVSPNQGFTVAE